MNVLRRNLANRTAKAARSAAPVIEAAATSPSLFDALVAGDADEGDVALVQDMSDAPARASVGNRMDDDTTCQRVTHAVSAWREALAQQVGASTLADVDLLGDAVIDLSQAHPSGIAQLYAGRTTRLTNLVRETAAQPAARRRAHAVQSRSAEQAGRYGLAATYLAIGLATWVEDSAGLGPEEEPDASAEFGGPERVRGLQPPNSDATPELTDVAAALDPAPEATPAAEVSSPEILTEPQPTSGALPALTQSLPMVSVTAIRPEGATAQGLDPLDIHSAAPGESRTLRAPLLLRPVMLTARAGDPSDFEITLEPACEINPVVVRALHARGIFFDPVALAGTTFRTGSFDPTAVLEYLSDLGQNYLEGFSTEEARLLGTFVHPGQALIEDLDALAPSLESHEVVAALAGVTEAAEAVQALQLPPKSAGDPAPNYERGVGDLDRDQRYVVDALATGGHLYVDAPLGADVAGTVAAVVAEAAAAGRNVLYVTGHRRAADSLSARLADLDLEDLLLDTPPIPTWRHAVTSRLLTAMASEAETYDESAVCAMRGELVAARNSLAEYVSALHTTQAPWNVSAYDALQALAILTSERPTPSTSVRLSARVALQLNADRRAALAKQLHEAAELGAFEPDTLASAWQEADLDDEQAAEQALARVNRLSRATLPQLRRHIAFVTEVTGLREPQTIAEFAEQLKMLDGMRSTLDLFHPMVFERSATDLVAATATRKWRKTNEVELGWTTCRRLRKRAKELLRPGVRVEDIHAALKTVAAQQEVWATHAERGGWPTLPEGLKSIEDTHQAVIIDLGRLQTVLEHTAVSGDFQTLAFDEVAGRLERLLNDAPALETLPARTRALRAAQTEGLGELIADFAVRRIRPPVVAKELELAWWGTVFEQILSANSALGGHSGVKLGALAKRFRDLDRRHVASLTAPVRSAVRAHLGVAMRDHREVAEQLFRTLIEGDLTSVRDLMYRYGEVVRRLRPVIVATPTLVPHLLTTERNVDLLVLDAIQHVNLETLMPAIARARQVVVVGDVRSASGTAVGALERVLPQVKVAAVSSQRDTALTRLLARHGYAESLKPAPMPRAESLIEHDLVPDAIGMPDRETGAIETTPAEVQRVVELAIEHAMLRPDSTLGIVALTARHAERVREALLKEVRSNPGLAPFFSGTRPEPVIVADITGVAGLVRDEIMLSVGFGRTPHGRVLQRFSTLEGEGGEAMLLGALGATRRRLTVVTSLASTDLDVSRLRTAGTKLLREVLELAEVRNGVIDPVTRSGEEFATELVDRLLVDLGERLWQQGYLVETNFGLHDGERLPLVVGHPDLPEQMLVAVVTDDAAYVAEPSVRVRDRQWTERLERLGWTVVHVWSAAAFLDPDSQAERIARVVQQLRDQFVGRPGVPVEPRQIVPVLMDDETLPEVESEGDIELREDPDEPQDGAEQVEQVLEIGLEEPEQPEAPKPSRRVVRKGTETQDVSGVAQDELNLEPDSNDQRLLADVPPHWG